MMGQQTEDRGWQLALGLIAVWRRTGDARKGAVAKALAEAAERDPTAADQPDPARGVPLVPPGGHPSDVQCPGGADNRPRRAVRSSASAASSSATRSETAVSVSGPKASTPWPPSRTACVPGRSPISSMTAVAEEATGTSS